MLLPRSRPAPTSAEHWAHQLRSWPCSAVDSRRKHARTSTLCGNHRRMPAPCESARGAISVSRRHPGSESAHENAQSERWPVSGEQGNSPSSHAVDGPRRSGIYRRVGAAECRRVSRFEPRSPSPRRGRYSPGSRARPGTGGETSGRGKHGGGHAPTATPWPYPPVLVERQIDLTARRSQLAVDVVTQLATSPTIPLLALHNIPPRRPTRPAAPATRQAHLPTWLSSLTGHSPIPLAYTSGTLPCTPGGVASDGDPAIPLIMYDDVDQADDDGGRVSVPDVLGGAGRSGRADLGPVDHVLHRRGHAAGPVPRRRVWPVWSPAGASYRARS